jgi:hypothetical protein
MWANIQAILQTPSVKNCLETSQKQSSNSRKNMLTSAYIL